MPRPTYSRSFMDFFFNQTRVHYGKVCSKKQNHYHKFYVNICVYIVFYHLL
jgi:hypothetical protein